MNYSAVFSILEQNADKENAFHMRAYMRDQFPYLGIPTPKRRELLKGFYKEAKKANKVDWDFVDACWEKPEREFQYVAGGYLQMLRATLTPADIPRLKRLALTKSWWDTVDTLDGVIGDIALRHPEVNETLLEWSIGDNIWLRRIAIDHQRERKDRTDTELLAKIIENNLGQKEFFINKAIGWSLREYSKTNPDWVRTFIEQHRDGLAPLSIREGGKYVPKPEICTVRNRLS